LMARSCDGISFLPDVPTLFDTASLDTNRLSNLLLLSWFHFFQAFIIIWNLTILGFTIRLHYLTGMRFQLSLKFYLYFIIISYVSKLIWELSCLPRVLLFRDPILTCRVLGRLTVSHLWTHRSSYFLS
jgi:hypothetical protein